MKAITVHATVDMMCVRACVQAFDEIVELQVLTAVEEGELLASLPIRAEDAVLQHLYAVRLNKVMDGVNCCDGVEAVCAFMNVPLFVCSTTRS